MGVCESDKTESRPLDRQPTVPFKTLLPARRLPGGRDEDTLTTLAAASPGSTANSTPPERQQIVTASGGQTPATLAGALLRAFDPDAIAERATGKPGAHPRKSSRREIRSHREQLDRRRLRAVRQTRAARDAETLKQETEQTIDIYTPDEVSSSKASMPRPRRKPPVSCRRSAIISSASGGD